jgi:hypothetical protein
MRTAGANAVPAAAGAGGRRVGCGWCRCPVVPVGDPAGAGRGGRQVRAPSRGRWPVRLAARRAVLRGRRPPPAGRLCRVPAGDGVVVGAGAGAVWLVVGRVPRLCDPGRCGHDRCRRAGGTRPRRRTPRPDPGGGGGGVLADPGRDQRAFQPVSFDQLATMVVLWLSLRLALGRGRGRCSGWPSAWGWRSSTRSRSSWSCC